MRLLSLILALLVVACQSRERHNSDLSKATDTNTVAADLIIDTLAEIVPTEDILKDNAITNDYIPKYDYDSTQWLDIKDLAPDIALDLRYATTNNFVNEAMYECGRCFLRKEVAAAVVAAHRDVQDRGYGGLIMFDCYRPRPIQWKLWEKVPNPTYVADPRKGSQHNRGGAVDLSILDAEGNELDMGTEFDFFGPEAHHTYTGHSDTVQANRDLLKEIMSAQNFRWIRTEWWHYSYKPKQYPISDMLWECEEVL